MHTGLNIECPYRERCGMFLHVSAVEGDEIDAIVVELPKAVQTKRACYMSAVPTVAGAVAVNFNLNYVGVVINLRYHLLQYIFVSWYFHQNSIKIIFYKTIR